MPLLSQFLNVPLLGLALLAGSWWPSKARPLFPGPSEPGVDTFAPELLPAALIQQLRPGGRMVVPAGLPDDQQLLVVDKDADGRIETREVLQVVFSPLINSH